MHRSTAQWTADREFALQGLPLDISLIASIAKVSYPYEYNDRKIRVAGFVNEEAA
jgi:hypothetical protein